MWKLRESHLWNSDRRKTDAAPFAVTSADGEWLFISSNRSGYVSKIKLEKVVSALRGAEQKSVDLQGWQGVYVGGGARTIGLSPDEKNHFCRRKWTSGN